jgi:ArsR family transcriptional regulator
MQVNIKEYLYLYMNASTLELLGRLKSLSDPIKIRLVALCAKAECSVSELTRVTRQSQPRISQHLKQLCAVDLLERFRDGHFVYYRVPTLRGTSATRRRLLALMPADEPQFTSDLERLRALRSVDDPAPVGAADRSLHRALVELTVARPLGDLLDVGCGQGRLLKLLASRARRVVGVDIDADVRRLARAEILLAGLPNCSLRQGDMEALPFDDASFDTVILDDVLTAAAEPVQALNEASRLLRPGGRILLLAAVGDSRVSHLQKDFSTWAGASGLRLAPPRRIPDKAPAWLLAVATPADSAAAAA